MADILVVDDRPIDRQFLQTLLGYAGHHVEAAADGDEALRRMGEFRPDLVITDIVMPTMDGLEFVNRLRENPDLAPVIVIFYTASFLRAEAERLASTGRVQRVLLKPSEPEAILKAVEAVLGAPPVESAPPPFEAPDRSALVNVTLHRTQRELESISQRLAVLLDLAREFATIAEPDRLIERLCAASRSVVGARFAVAGVFEPGRDRLSRFIALGVPAGEDPQPQLASGALADIVRANRIVRKRLPGSPARDFGLDVAWTKITSVLAVPIAVPGRTIGFVCLLNKLGADEFSDDEARVVETLAAQAAVAHENIRLMLETERRLQFVTALRSIDVAITGSLDIRLTLDVVLDQVVTHLGVDGAAILLYNRGSNMLESAAIRGIRGESAVSRSVRYGIGLAGAAAHDRRMTGFTDSMPEKDEDALLHGERWATYFAAPLVAKGRCLGVLEVFNRSALRATSEWRDFFEALAGQAAIAIDEAELFNDLQRANADLVAAYDSTLEGWVHALDLRDKETVGHTQRVTEMTVALARLAGFTVDELVHVRRGSILHDIGKLGVPDSILLKPAKLTDGEWKIMKRHPALAFEWIRPISYLRPALDIPYCHHEKWDGTGYPRGLKGESIPIAARLFACVDIWDALTSDRPYRAAWAKSKVAKHIRELSGTHLAPEAVDLFFTLPALGAGGPVPS